MVKRELYPIFCNLEGRSVLVVGGGKVACRKIESLRFQGAAITVVSPDVVPELQQIIIESGIHWLPRRFEESDLNGIHLVFAATNDANVNQDIATSAKSKGLLVNSVTNPEVGNFYVPSRVSRGPLQIAISTSGYSPAAAKQIKEQIALQYPDEYETYLELLNEVRDFLKNTLISESKRTEIAKWFVHSDLLLRISQEEVSNVRNWVQEQLLRFSTTSTHEKGD